MNLPSRLVPWCLSVVLFFTSAFVFVVPPTNAASLAQFAGCSGPDCSACNVAYIANGLIGWLIGFLFVLFAGLMAWAGFRLVTAGGNKGALDDAKDSFANALIGIIIVVSAWLIVDTIMRGLVGNSANPGSLEAGGSVSGWLFWSDIQCYEQVDPTFAGVYVPPPQPNIPDLYDNGISINESSLPPPSGTAPISTTPPQVTGDLVTYAGRLFDAGIVPNVQYIATTFGLRVSGGYRSPERNREVGGAANSYHLTGRAADFVGTQAQMQAARQWAGNNGAREALIHDAGSGVHLHVAW